MVSNYTKTALITGASAGIGRATARSLAASGYQLILLARRQQALDDLQIELGEVNTHLIACDVNDKDALCSALDKLPDDFQKIDVLVNNAGLALGLDTADKTNWQDWQTMIETNCVSLAFLTRQILPAMVKRNSGYVINLGSAAGTYAYKGGNVYGASKAFVEHFSMGLRSDLLGTNVRVCCLIPGLIGGTEFSNVRFHGDQNTANAVYQNCEPLIPEDIAETVVWVLSQPERVNINRMEIMPVCQAPGGPVVHKSELT